MKIMEFQKSTASTAVRDEPSFLAMKIITFITKKGDKKSVVVLVYATVVTKRLTVHFTGTDKSNDHTYGWGTATNFKLPALRQAIMDMVKYNDYLWMNDFDKFNLMGTGWKPSADANDTTSIDNAIRLWLKNNA